MTAQPESTDLTAAARPHPDHPSGAAPDADDRRIQAQPATPGVRTLLFTGKGGVGKSTIAAGTAGLAAASGQRTLVLSTDAAHSLADALGVDAGPEPTAVAPHLFVQQVDAQLRFQQSWAAIQRYLLSVLDVAGVDRVAAEELTVIPGAEEVLALLELRVQVRSGRWDVIVVDCAPTAETLRLLALPEALGWYMQRVFPFQRRVVTSLRPLLSRAAGAPMPESTVFDAVEQLHTELADVRELLVGPRSTVRLVLTPERVVLAEARRCYTTLSLFGYRVDGVAVNRVFPTDECDRWRSRWVAAQAEVMEQISASFVGIPVWRAGYRDHEPLGLADVTDLAAGLYAGTDPTASVDGREPLRLTRNGTATIMRLALPLARRDDVALGRNGDDLVVTVGSYRRLLTLPTSLSRHRVTGARVDGGELQVRFEEVTHDPAPPDDPPADQTGTVGEELAKLLGALSELAGSKPASDAAATPLSAVQDLSDRWLADGHGGPDCRYCPICRALHLVRECSPEVRTHLAVAAMSLLQAGAAVLSTQIPRDPDPHPRDGVQPIDVEDGMPWPDTATDHDGAVSSDNDEE